MSSELDPEWQATLRRFRMRGIEQRRAERADPKLRELPVVESSLVPTTIKSESSR